MAKHRIMTGDYVWVRLRNGHVKLTTVKGRSGEQFKLRRSKGRAWLADHKHVTPVLGSTRLLE